MERVLQLVLVVVLILYAVQSLSKFVLGFTVSYEKRINQIASYYARDHRAITRFDTISLIVMLGAIALLFLTDMQYLSFATGLFVGMNMMQVFFHRFIRPLPQDKMPPEPIPPVKHVSYAIQAQPGLAWREITFMSVLIVWILYMLIAHGLFG